MKIKNLLLKVFSTLVLYVYCIKKGIITTAILVEERDFEKHLDVVVDKGEKFN